MLKIGITGGIGAGKSVICKVFKTLNIPVYDADSRAKSLMIHDAEVKAKIIASFGESSYDESGELNRAFLAAKVFNNDDEIKKINAIVHPAVANDFQIWFSKQDAPYVIKEAALLIESGSYKDLDKIILVKAAKNLRIQRISKRDPHRTEEQIQGILAKQIEVEEAENFADFIIDNSGNKPILKEIIEIHKKLIS